MIVLSAGKTVLDDSVSSKGANRMSREIRRSLIPQQESSTSDLRSPSVLRTGLVFRETGSESDTKAYLPQSQEETKDNQQDRFEECSGHDSSIEVEEQHKMRSRGFSNVFVARQIRSLAQRAQQQIGWGWLDVLVLTVAVALVAICVSFKNVFQVQIVLMTLAMIGLPGVILPHKIVEYDFLWKAHKLETDDRKISLFSFQLSTSVITFSVPTIAVFVSTLIAYFILGWSFETFIVQSTFSVVHMMLELQLGRVLVVLFRGEFSLVIKVYTFYLFLCFIFSSVPVASRKFPPSLRWLVLLSIDFWAISGAIMNHFDDEHYSSEEDCFDFLTCLLSDGSFIVRYLRFAPLSTSFRALGVLTGCFSLLYLLEYALLRYRCGGVSFFGTLDR